MRRPVDAAVCVNALVILVQSSVTRINYVQQCHHACYSSVLFRAARGGASCLPIEVHAHIELLQLLERQPPKSLSGKRSGAHSVHT
jgi:hypothetical protein